MTLEELIEGLRKLEAHDDGYCDLEEVHIQADNLLLEYINDPEVTEAFEKIDKWYS